MDYGEEITESDIEGIRYSCDSGAGRTRARNLDEIDVMTRDVISPMLEIPADSFDLEFTFEDSQ